jgi:hypothetical protein
MAKPFKSLLIKLAEKAGVPQDNPGLLDLLSKIDLSFEDTAYDSFDKFLNDAMTLDIAKKHPDVVKHYNATIFNGMDAKVKTMATEHGLDATEIAAIDAEKNSYEKFKLLQSFAKAKLEKEFATKGGAGKEELAKEIQKLNADIVAERENAQKAIIAAKEQAENDTLNYAFESYLGGKKYANEDIPGEVNVMTAKNLTQSELQKLGAKIVRKDGKLTLVNAQNPELPFIKDNKEVSFNDLTDSILANNKLLKVSDPAAPAPVRKTFHQPDGPKQQDTSNITSAIDAQLRDLGVAV